MGKKKETYTANFGSAIDLLQRTIHIARVSAVDGDALGTDFVAGTTADCAALERDEAGG